MPDEFKASDAKVVEIPKTDPVIGRKTTLSAISSKVPVIYQAFLEREPFARFANFLLLDESGSYQVWDTKLAHSPKPYYAIQLCCYSDMLAAVTETTMPKKFGLILGTKDRVEFRIEDFIHYYRRIKTNFLGMQNGFTGRTANPLVSPLYRPLPAFRCGGDQRRGHVMGGQGATARNADSTHRP